MHYPVFFVYFSVKKRAGMNTATLNRRGLAVSALPRDLRLVKRGERKRDLSGRQLIGDLFGGIGPDFRERGVIMGDGGEIANCGSVVHRHDDFVNEVGSLGANDGGSEDFAGCAMREKFYESLGFAHDE